jgi:hypothetical protein
MDIPLGESSAKIISIEGLPDLIYSKEYRDNSVFTSLIWVNPSTDDNELLQSANNSNIQIGGDINNILDNYNAISFHYNDILFLDFNSLRIMEFKDNILIICEFIINTNDIQLETREIGSNILNYYGKLYGEPKQIARFTLLWELETINLLFQLQPIFNNRNRTDIIRIIYSNKDDRE